MKAAIKKNQPYFCDTVCCLLLKYITSFHPEKFAVSKPYSYELEILICGCNGNLNLEPGLLKKQAMDL